LEGSQIEKKGFSRSIRYREKLKGNKKVCVLSYYPNDTIFFKNRKAMMDAIRGTEVFFPVYPLNRYGHGTHEQEIYRLLSEAPPLLPPRVLPSPLFLPPSSEPLRLQDKREEERSEIVSEEKRDQKIDEIDMNSVSASVSMEPVDILASPTGAITFSPYDPGSSGSPLGAPPLCKGGRFSRHVSPLNPSLWRSLPGAFFQGRQPVILTWSLNALNKGNFYSLYVLKSCCITDEVLSVLRDSFFAVQQFNGYLVLRDLPSVSGAVYSSDQKIVLDFKYGGGTSVIRSDKALILEQE
jgi:hypothetical protein